MSGSDLDGLNDDRSGKAPVAFVRHAEERDLRDLTEIYNHYVLHSHATFDVAPQTIAQRRDWFARYSASGPYRILVADSPMGILGCAYSSRYREHAAFDHTIETSVYVHPDRRSRGVGKALYGALFASLKRERIRLAVAGIALPNEASIALHRSFGFTEVGIFRDYAQKNGRLISSIWMQKTL